MKDADLLKEVAAVFRRAEEAEADRLLLRGIAAQLNRWANDSREGDSSTHQVEGNEALAARIYRHLDRVSEVRGEKP